MKYYPIILLLLTLSGNTLSQTGWPEVSSENKPWSRWWWQGNAVDTANLGILMETYAKAGLGGLEIVPIYGVKGEEDKYLPYLGSEWMKVLSFVLRKADELNIGIDMANGTGWPFGGSWVSQQDASAYLAHQSYDLHGGESISGKLLYSNQYSRTVARHSQTIDQKRYADQLRPFRVMAYDNTGTAIDITSKLDENGLLNWTAPEGSWKVIALFSAGHGKMVERAAPGAEGYAIDHFSKQAVTRYLQYFDSAFAGTDISGIRCMFNDSYEVDDAFGQADWTHSLPEEFIKRRGYDLLQYLPALLSNDSSETTQRVTYDYRLTVSELLLDGFTKPWGEWTNNKGALTRNQAHGSPANILDLYAASDIPETEGNDLFRFKFASSAGNGTGKKLISAEAATWLNDHFISTLADVKKAADLYFLGGVNHILYHGTAYSPVSDPWPGWLFYAAVHFQPTNPIWEHFPALNSYIARTQSLLQQGQADNDVLLYYPIADRFSDRGNQLLRHFDGMEKEFGITDFAACARHLQDQGYTFDFISDLQLLETSVSNKQIHTKGSAYQTILIPECRYMTFETWQHLNKLVEQGATIIFHNALPTEVPGLNSHKINQPVFDTMKQSLAFSASGNNVKEALTGQGIIMLSSEINSMLTHAKIRREIFVGENLQFVRRKAGNNTMYFIQNNGQDDFSGWIPLHCEAASAAIYDAYLGKWGKAAFRLRNGNTPEVYLQLKPAATLMVMAYRDDISAVPYSFYQPKGMSLNLGNAWKVDFIRGGPVMPVSQQITKLSSYTEWSDELKAFSGLVKYSTTFARPSGRAQNYILNLGRVHDCAEVRINGKTVATLIGDDFSVVVDATLLKKKNVLEVFVANRMANRIADMDKKGQVYKKFHNVNFPAYRRENVGSDGLFSAAAWQPLPAGLLGPVTIAPAEIFVPK